MREGHVGHADRAGDLRPDLLFLCHRIPYPPDKGDKIRSYHWLLALAESFRVHLAAFVDDPDDWTHRNRVEALCDSCLLLPLEPKVGKMRGLCGLLTGEPLSLPYYRDRRLQRWLGRLWRSRDIRYLLVYSSAMAQYVVGAPFDQARRVIDFVDVDSDKWRQYAARMRTPMKWIYGREATRLAAFDQAVARVFDRGLFVSPAEAAWFCEQLDVETRRVASVTNGVDGAYFAPEQGGESPYPGGCKAVVFTGAMDYQANVDAVTWFARRVWPRIRAAEPRTVFYIVGSRPAGEVKDLAGDGIFVTARVADVRPFLRYAEVAVAPMRIARGIQNKVLEAMSMARPVIVTSKGLEGIAARDGRELLVADDAEAFARRVLDVLARGCQDMGVAARSLAQRDYAWENSCRRLVRLVTGDADREASLGSALAESLQSV
jgi:sugar transferase (PEP-CTERM/EpsH1 system associated)